MDNWIEVEAILVDLPLLAQPPFPGEPVFLNGDDFNGDLFSPLLLARIVGPFFLLHRWQIRGGIS